MLTVAVVYVCFNEKSREKKFSWIEWKKSVERHLRWIEWKKSVEISSLNWTQISFYASSLSPPSSSPPSPSSSSTETDPTKLQYYFFVRFLSWVSIHILFMHLCCAVHFVKTYIGWPNQDKHFKNAFVNGKSKCAFNWNHFLSLEFLNSGSVTQTACFR